MQNNLISPARKGMNKDINISNLDGTVYPFALNAAIQSNSQDGNILSIQNETSNISKVEFPAGFVVNGRRRVIEQGRTLYTLVNPTTGASQIGEVRDCSYNDNKDDITGFSACADCLFEEQKERKPLETIEQEPFCSYRTIISSDCLNFNIDYPVKIRYKITDCGINIYFTDRLNQRRYLYFDYENGNQNDNLVINQDFKVITGYEDEPCSIPIYSDELDCNKLSYHPNYSIPCVDTDIVTGGSLQAGIYQFFTGYSDIKANVLTDITPASHPIPIFTKDITVETNYKTNNAISIKLSNVETSGVYSYFNLIVAETVDNFTTFKLVGTYPVNKKSIIYTGQEGDLKKLTPDEIFGKRAYYKNASGITDANNILFFSDLEEFSKPNFQRVANNVELFWKTVAVPENVYRNPLFTFNFKGYQRDEVYPLGLVFVKTTGEEVGPFHIPGPSKTKFFNTYGINVDLTVSNNDVLEDTSCNNITRNKRWQVYNTGKLIGTPHEATPTCNTNSTWEWGEFAYWESLKTYPNNPEVWGDLCGQPIRYHKFPDSNVTHIHDGLNGTKSFFDSNIIYPIGLRVNHQSVINALVQAVNDGIILQSEVDELAGYRIIRGNRVGNKSIVAKGLLYDMWSYDKNNNKYYYSNYPYNDLRNDKFISNNENTYQGGNNSNPIPNVFLPTKRYTFHSPDTHFNNPQIGTEIKIETEEYGTSEGFFNLCDEQSKYKFLSTFARTFAFAAGVAAAFSKEKEHQTMTITSGARGTSPIDTFPAGVDGIPRPVGVGLNFTGKLDSPIHNPTGFFRDPFGWSETTGLTDPLQYFPLAEQRTREFRKGTTFQLLNPLSGNPAGLFLQQAVYMGLIGLKEMQIMADLLKAIAPIKNFAIQYNSVGRYNNYKKVDNSGNKIRKIERSAYLEPIIQLINEAINTSASQFTNVYVNNWNRERSVYLKTDINKTAFPSPTTTDTSRITMDDINFDQEDLEKRAYRPISSYYCSIKNFLPEQYGDVTDVNYIETSGCMFKLDNTYTESQDGVYGGDTFITRFGLKRKMPFFLQSRFRMPNEADVRYSELGNVGFPNYYFNVEEPLLERIGGNTFGGNVLNILTDLIGVANTRLDAKKQKAFYQSGFIHLYNYGIPYFLAESDVNCDFRHGENVKEKDFYPHQQDLGYWLQEKNVPITEDNYYFYNSTYSKQNKESFIGTEKLDVTRECKTKYPFRIIHSETSNNDNTFDNWLVFKSNNLYDASASLGRVIGLDGIENSKVFIRFENTSQMFNAYDVLNVDTSVVQVGNGGLFTTRPKEFSSVELGHAGSQHSSILKTEFGHIWVDAKRGKIFNLLPNASGLSEISEGMSSWFIHNLPFNISKDFPEIDLQDIDNNYKGIGLHLSFDKKFSRLFLTKMDYKKIHCDVTYNTGLKQFEVNGEKIELCDTRYLADMSWTISYSFISKSWVSYHSFVPNYYVDGISSFESGINNFTNNGVSSLWEHNITNKSYQVYYGKLYPFVIEILSNPQIESSTLNSVQYDCDVVRYHNLYDSFYNRNITFNKAIIYNERQCSGLLELIPRAENNHYLSIQYPKVENNKIQILTTNKDNMWRFNQFFDTVNSQTGNLPFFTYSKNNVDKELNLNALNYFKSDFNKQAIRGKQTKIRLINDVKSNYNFIFNFNQTINTTSKA
jgi:hypothetical protein